MCCQVKCPDKPPSFDKAAPNSLEPAVKQPSDIINVIINIVTLPAVSKSLPYKTAYCKDMITLEYAGPPVDLMFLIITSFPWLILMRILIIIFTFLH